MLGISIEQYITNVLVIYLGTACLTSGKEINYIYYTIHSGLIVILIPQEKVLDLSFVLLNGL